MRIQAAYRGYRLRRTLAEEAAREHERLELVAMAQRWERQLMNYRANSATRRMPLFLLGHPVLSVVQAAAGLEISQPAANAAMNNLLAAGIVNLVDERQWGRVFKVNEILERLDRPPT